MMSPVGWISNWRSTYTRCCSRAKSERFFIASACKCPYYPSLHPFTSTKAHGKRSWQQSGVGLGVIAQVLVQLRQMWLTKSVPLCDGPVRESEGTNGRRAAIWTRESPAYL